MLFVNVINQMYGINKIIDFMFFNQQINFILFIYKIDVQICCPHEKTNITDGIKSSVGSGTRLITMDEGCGITKVTLPRVVGGIPAKKGKCKIS